MSNFNLKVVAASACVPHPEKRQNGCQCGEDAFFFLTAPNDREPLRFVFPGDSAAKAAGKHSIVVSSNGNSYSHSLFTNVTRSGVLSYIRNYNKLLNPQILGAFGIADGVSGTKKFGVNSGPFANKLMEYALQHVFTLDQDQNFQFNEHKPYEFPAFNILQKAEKQLALESIEGSATGISAILLRDGKMLVSSVGDSSLLLLRPKENQKPRDGVQHVEPTKRQIPEACQSPASLAHAFRDVNYSNYIYRTPISQHKHNTPCTWKYYSRSTQIARETGSAPELEDIDEHEKALNPTFFDTWGTKKINEQAIIHSVQVEPGDIVILASDGVFDNAYDEYIRYYAEFTLSAVNKTRKSFYHPESYLQYVLSSFANNVMQVALKNIYNPQYNITPWSHFHSKEPGGKLDDLSCVCFMVYEDMELDKNIPSVPELHNIYSDVESKRFDMMAG